MIPSIGTDVIYRTDSRNGLVYDLPAKVTVTRESHPGDYPGGEKNPLPVPDEGHVHLTVFTPGGFGSQPVDVMGDGDEYHMGWHDEDFVGAPTFIPGSGTYVEHNVPFAGADCAYVPTDTADPTFSLVPPRTWRLGSESSMYPLDEELL